MDFLVLLFFGWIFWAIVKAAAAQSAKKPPLPPAAVFDVSQVPREHVIYMDGTRVVGAHVESEESSSELLWDETAGDQELDATGAVPAEAVSLESTEVALPPPPAAPVALSLEAEVVDWDAEHERFHKRYVDVRTADVTPAHGLMDDLRDPASLRRAVLFSEILGPPKALRITE